MANLTRDKKSIAKSFVMMPFLAASIIFVAIAGFAIGFNYQGEIQVALGADGGSLDIKGCPR